MNRSRLGRMAVTSIGVVAMTASMFGVSAEAADNTASRKVTANNYTTPDNGGWSLSGSNKADADFDDVAGGAAGVGALHLSTENARAIFASEEFADVSLGDVEAIALSTHTLTDDSVAIEVIVGGTRSNLTNPTFEAVVRFDPSVQRVDTVAGEWQRWNATHASIDPETNGYTDASGVWTLSGGGFVPGSCAVDAGCSFQDAVAAFYNTPTIHAVQLVVGARGSKDAAAARVDDVVVDFVKQARNTVTNALVRGKRYDFEPVGASAVEIAADFEIKDLTVDPTGAYNVTEMDFTLTGDSVEGRRVTLVRVDASGYKQQVGECDPATAAGEVHCLILDGFRPALGDHVVQARTPGSFLPMPAAFVLSNAS